MTNNRTVIWSDIDDASRREVYRFLRDRATDMRHRGTLLGIADAFDALANLLAANDTACAELLRRGE